MDQLLLQIAAPAAEPTRLLAAVRAAAMRELATGQRTGQQTTGAICSPPGWANTPKAE